MPRGATCSLISKAITIGGGSTPLSATSPRSRQTGNPHNPVSTFPGEGQGHTDPGLTQAGNQRGHLPVTVRDRSPQPQTARASATAARHVGGRPRLVDEDQAIGIERRLAANEHAPGLGYIRPLLLGRVQGLFLSVNFWPARNRCTVLSPTVTPHEAASALRISCKVKSGCRATNCSTFARCSPNRERRSPPIARGRAWPSARQR